MACFQVKAHICRISHIFPGTGYFICGSAESLAQLFNLGRESEIDQPRTSRIGQKFQLPESHTS